MLWLYFMIHLKFPDYFVHTDNPQSDFLWIKVGWDMERQLKLDLLVWKNKSLGEELSQKEISDSTFTVAGERKNKKESWGLVI